MIIFCYNFALLYWLLAVLIIVDDWFDKFIITLR